MQVYDQYFLNYMLAFRTLCNVILHEDKSLCLFGYVEVCPYLAVT